MPSDTSFYSKFKTVDDAANSLQQSKYFKNLDTHSRQIALNKMREEFSAAHVMTKPPAEKGELKTSLVPAEEEKPKEPVAAPNERDTTGRIVGGLESRLGEAGKTLGPANELKTVSEWILPHDNAQAFIDAGQGALMLSGIGEVEEGALWGYRGLSLLAKTILGPTSMGAIGGAVEGGKEGAITGGAKGLTESTVARGLGSFAQTEGYGRKAATWLGRKAGVLEDPNVADLGRISDWLKERFPKTIKGKLKNSSDVFDLLKRPVGEDRVPKLEMEANETFAKAEKDVKKVLAKPEPAAPAPKKTVFSKDVPSQRRELNDAIAKAEQAGNKAEVSRLRTQREGLLNKELGGKGSKSTKLSDEAPNYLGGKGPRTASKTVQEPKMLELTGVPPTVAKQLGIPQGGTMKVSFDDATAIMRDVEDKGWDLAGHPVTSKQGAFARSAAIQMEDYIAEQLSNVDRKAAIKWYTARQNQRLAKAMTNLFGDPDVLDKTGRISVDALRQKATNGYLQDLAWATNPREVDSFLTAAFPKAKPPYIEQGGQFPRPSFGGHALGGARVYFHGGRFPESIPMDQKVPVDRLPGYLGRGRALSAALVLGPERFIQMLGDVSGVNDLPANQPNKANQ